MQPGMRPVAVVTGATSGIGAALAACLAAREHDLLLVARSAEALQRRADELAAQYGVRARARAADLTDPGQRAVLAGELAETDVQLLCANAGVAGFGPFTEIDNVSHVELNVISTVELLTAVLPGMLARRRGALLLTGSLAGNQPMPGAASYAASKAFVASLGEALHAELRGTGVRCTVLTPGPTRTAFVRRAGLEQAARRLPDAVWTSAEQVAETGLRALADGRRRVTPRMMARLMGAGGRLAPHPLALPVIRALIRRYV